MYPYMRSIGLTSDRQINYYFRFFWAGLLEVMRIWVRDGCPETPEELTGFIGKSIRDMPETVEFPTQQDTEDSP